MIASLFKTRPKPIDTLGTYPCSTCGAITPASGKKAHQCPECKHKHSPEPTAPVERGLEAIGGVSTVFLARTVDRLANVAPEDELPTLDDASAYVRMRFGLPTPIGTQDDRPNYCRGLPAWLVSAADDDARDGLT